MLQARLVKGNQALHLHHRTLKLSIERTHEHHALQFIDSSPETWGSSRPLSTAWGRSRSLISCLCLQE